MLSWRVVDDMCVVLHKMQHMKSVHIDILNGVTHLAHDPQGAKSIDFEHSSSIVPKP